MFSLHHSMPTRWTSVRTLLCGTRRLEFGLPSGRKSPSTPPPGSCPTPNGCLAVTMGLVQTPQGHQQSSWRTPVLKPSSNSSLSIAWITALATDASLKKWLFSRGRANPESACIPLTVRLALNSQILKFSDKVLHDPVPQVATKLQAVKV